MDWITLLIELIGVAILLMWIVIPIREFRQILRIVKTKPHAMRDEPDDATSDPRHGFPVKSNQSPRRKDGPTA